MARAGKERDGGIVEDMQPARRGSKGRRDDGAQLRRRRGDGWTAKKKARFLEVLRATCNVQEGLRTVGMGHSGVYHLRKQDPQFAAAWGEAIEQGYAELEMHLLHQSLFGAKTTEVIDDGTGDGPKRTKTVHGFPHVIALRLLLAHKDKVHAYRAGQGIERPGSDRVRAEIQEKLARVRARLADEARRDAAEKGRADRDGYADGDGRADGDADGGRDGNA